MRILLLVLALGSAGVTAAVVRASQKEPPLRLTIELDGQSIPDRRLQGARIYIALEPPSGNGSS
ncbi:MAG: hypothetical protein MK213_07495 [Planctomycetes bacterium]|nr:hypothetical protein [Planctomycetota bacterium]